MSITVPQAGVIAGRAPQNVQVATPDTGEVLFGFGQRMAEIGSGLKKEALGRELGQARLNMMTGLNELRLKFAQIGNPDQIDREWGPQTTALRTQIMGGLNPENQADAGMMFDELAQTHTFAVGQTALAARQSQKIATINATGDLTARVAATSDPQTAMQYQGQYFNGLQALVADGTLSAEDAQARYQAMLTASDEGRMTILLTENPEALIAGIDGKQLGQSMDPGTSQGWRTRAAAVVATRQTAAAASGLAAAKDLLKDGAAVLRKGGSFANTTAANAALLDPAIRATPEARQYVEAAVLAREMPDFAGLPLDQKRARLATAAATPKADSSQFDRQDAMAASIAEHEAAIKTGTLWSYATATAGLPAPRPLPDPAQSTDAALTAALTTRAHAVAGLQATGLAGTAPAPIFTPDERAVWGALATAGASPADQTRLAMALGALGRDAPRAATELGAGDTFAYLSSGLAAGAIAPQLASQVFEGVKVQERNQTPLPGIATRRSLFFTKFSGLFADGTIVAPGLPPIDESAARDQVLTAADALYAYRQRNVAPEPQGGINEEAYKQALHEVLGGKGSYDTDTATGGIATLHSRDGSYMSLLPANVAAAEVDAAKTAMLTRWFRKPPTFEIRVSDWNDVGGDAASWARISHNGAVPAIGGALPEYTTLDRLRFDPVQGELYTLKTADGVTVLDSTGAPYLLDMARFLAEFGTKP